MESILRRFLVFQMIVCPRDNHVRLISQHDHARAAGTIARNWVGIGSLPSPPDELTEKVLFAIDNHDVGWCRSDATPRWDALTKLPYSFFGITADKAVEIWSEGIDSCASFHPFSGYLVSLHFSSLAAGGRRGAPLEVSKVLNGFIHAESKRQKELDALIEPKHIDAIENSVSLLGVCDTLSLLACRAPEITPPDAAVHPLIQGGLKVKTANTDDLEISPWPFSKDSVELRMPGLVLPGEYFADEKELSEAVPMAEPIVFSSVLRRLPDDMEPEAEQG